MTEAFPTRDAANPDAGQGSPGLAAFHAGERAALEGCYRAHFAAIERAIGGVLGGADRETVIHELFSRLVASEELRRKFTGGSLVAWLCTIAHNQAIDYQRRLGRETPLGPEGPGTAGPSWQEAADARVLIERFRHERLPAEWSGVFELRFLQQMTQHEAARALGLHRTTLAYRELRIRRALRAFLLEDEEP